MEFIDRLLVAAVVEARGCERFERLAEALDDPLLRPFYAEIAESEGRHAMLFVELAQIYLSKKELEPRLELWLDREAEAIAAIAPHSALH